MTELETDALPDEETPAHPGGPAARAPSGKGAESVPSTGMSMLLKVAKIRCLDQVKARGFTFARGKVVEGVPLAHAEYLAAGGKAEVLEVI